MLAEYDFITQEFQLCDKSDKDSINSLIKAIQSFREILPDIVQTESINIIRNYLISPGRI
jgi:hypothetical protein